MSTRVLALAITGLLISGIGGALFAIALDLLLDMAIDLLSRRETSA